ncbi:uncharacterized protein LOC135810955 [Sycon ciliatum]|uniref:uncharacterized protein LOC135810955 n=1 Tax=Sycon ciliatum TaxID=27933 RepID=UPI0031F6E217
MATPMYAIASCLLCVLYCISSGQASTASLPQLFLVEGRNQFQGWQYRRLFMPTYDKKTWQDALRICIKRDAVFSQSTKQVGLLSQEYRRRAQSTFFSYMWRFSPDLSYPFATNGENSKTSGKHHVACLANKAVNSCSTDSDCPISLGYRCFPAVVPGSIKKCVRTYDTPGDGKSFYRLLTTNKTPYQAKATCRSLGMGLPTVQDRAILKSFKLQDQLLIFNSAWLGMNSNGEFIFIQRLTFYKDVVVEDSEPLLGDIVHFICTGSYRRCLSNNDCTGQKACVSVGKFKICEEVCWKDDDCPTGYYCFPALKAGTTNKCVRTYKTPANGNGLYRLHISTALFNSQAKKTCEGLGMSLPNPENDDALLNEIDQLGQNKFWLGYGPDSGRFELINRRGQISTHQTHELVYDLVPESTSTVFCTSFYRRCHFDTDCATYQTCVGLGTLKVCLTEHTTCRTSTGITSHLIGLDFGTFTYPEAASKCRQLNYDLVPFELYNANYRCIHAMAFRMLDKQSTRLKIAFWYTPFSTLDSHVNIIRLPTPRPGTFFNVPRREVSIICSKPQ